ncbi:hypothetical protein ABZ027_27775 [Streptomyces sp. NPDC006332]|uniref:hypothetical protein n=1 Tax=Streptomyces sp. NPDC006332 TaxID=3155456 RepID=UPI0033A8E702
MADEQYTWLDRETAERLLSGESLEAVDVTDRDRAERLAKTLDALSVETAPTGLELPGEDAALAAFRAARATREDSLADRPDGGVAPGRTGGRAGSGERARVGAADIGLVRVGGPGRDGPRPRRGRTIRLGLAAALAVGMVGSVAAAVKTGVLPAVFGEAEPGPGASASAPATPDRPLVPPSPGASRSEPSPGGATGGGSSPGSSHDTGPKSATPGAGSDGGAGHPWNATRDFLTTCRDMRDGRGLTAERRHALEGAAGGASRVKKYCKVMLADGVSADNGRGKGRKGREERTDQDRGGDQDDDRHRDGRGHRGGGAGGNGNRGGRHGHAGTDATHRGSGGDRHDHDGRNRHDHDGGNRHHPDGGTADSRAV